MKADLITTAVPESLAGATAFRRGEEYFALGAVGRSASCQVELQDDAGDLTYDRRCTGLLAASPAYR